MVSRIENSVHADYAYLYDYTKAVYTPLSLNGTGAGRRSGHAGEANIKFTACILGTNPDLLQPFSIIQTSSSCLALMKTLFFKTTSTY